MHSLRSQLALTALRSIMDHPGIQEQLNDVLSGAISYEIYAEGIATDAVCIADAVIKKLAESES